MTALLGGPRARGAFLLRTVVSPPWAMRIADAAPLTLVAVVQGTAVIVPDGGTPRMLTTGTVAMVRTDRPYVVADDPATAPQVAIMPGQRCVPLSDQSPPMTAIGVRTWGNARDTGRTPGVTSGGAHRTTLLTGTYEHTGEVGRHLLRLLPPLVVVPPHEGDADLLGLLAGEATRDSPGQEAVLDRLLDLLLVSTLRRHLSGPAAGGWFAAQSDPAVGTALRLIHEMPQEPWTVASLAARCAMSRAAFARRFTAVVGTPPLTYLTQWRLSLAADLLLEPGATLASVARAVGYGSPYALSAAFTRERGVSPRRHRAGGATDGGRGGQTGTVSVAV